MATRNYTSLYEIKNFLISQIAPKYLSSDEMNMSQTGLFGYITETLSTLGEDGLNATSMVFKECFANAAENIESLYLMAAIYQLENFFATPATMQFILLIEEDEILSRAKNENGLLTFYIDSATRFEIDGMVFNLEYDIRINSKKARDSDYIHTAQYVWDHSLTISKSKNQYIQSKIIRYNNENFLALLVTLRQMTSQEFHETIITNDRINVSEFDFNLGSDVQIAGFEAYYTPPSSTSGEIQLIKKLANTAKLSDPFCFYTMPDEGVLRISFANDERFFIPEFNSQLRVVIYTTDGEKGNFDEYTGDDINVITYATKYSENNGLIIFGQCSGDSSGGNNVRTFDEFRNAVITAQSTVNSFSTANDLELYFKSLIEAGNTQIMFMKRRDDALVRLFNAFVLLTDSNKVVLPTNTCDLMIEEEDIDADYPSTYRSLIKAGRIYQYSNKFPGCLEVNDELTPESDLDPYEDDFLYTNPFLMILSSRPVNAGLYLNSVNDDIPLDTETVNKDSFVQFMVSSLNVKRNAVLGENKYRFTIKLLPTSADLSECVVLVKDDTLVTEDDRTFVNPTDGKTYIDLKKIQVMIAFQDSGTETCYFELELFQIDDYYHFEGYIETDDYVSANNKVKLVNSVKDINTGLPLSEKFIPCNQIIANVYTFYKHEDISNMHHKYENIGVAVGLTMTNKYSSKTTMLDLITPLNMVNAFLSYNQYIDKDGKETYNYRIASVPMIKANYLKNEERFKKFVNIFSNIYGYLDQEIDRLTNNFNIDIKFYNTYGKSKNYTIGDDKDTEQPLNRTNIRLHFGVKPYYTTDIENLLKDLQEYILDYLRSGFDSHGNNALYISNLIRSIEDDYSDKVEHLIYRGIDNYDLSIQKIEPKITNENIQDYYSTMLDYVPEYINAYYKFNGGKYEPEIILDVI